MVGVEVDTYQNTSTARAMKGTGDFFGDLVDDILATITGVVIFTGLVAVVNVAGGSCRRW